MSVDGFNIESTEEDDNYNMSIFRHRKVALLFPQLTLQNLMKEGIGRNRKDPYTPTRVFQSTVVSRSHRVSTIVAARHQSDMVRSNKEGSSSTDHDQHAVCFNGVQP